MENVIVEYRPEHQPHFERLNRSWIEQYFRMEEIDVQVLQHPDKYIIDKGGAILIAICDGEVAGTCALKCVSKDVLEFTKMAVDEKYRGRHVGKALVNASIEKAKQMGATKVILYSNTVLNTAIMLYRKLGFIEIPVDGPYKRSNIKMEFDLYPGTEKIIVRHAFAPDAAAIAKLGADTFYETFVSYNSAEDMDEYLRKNFTIDQVESELKDSANTVLLAVQNKRPVGYAKLRKGQTPEGLNETNNIEIERLYVSKDFLGKKVGQLLMDACLEYAKLDEHKVVWLGVWENNPRAIAFYEKYGFTKFGQHDFLLGTDLQIDWMMKKDLVKKEAI